MSIVVPTALHASETWKSTANIRHKLDIFHQRCICNIMRISWRNHVINDEVISKAKLQRLSDIVRVKRLKLAGHNKRIYNIGKGKRRFV